jgi:hypothetical protein
MLLGKRSVGGSRKTLPDDEGEDEDELERSETEENEK